MRLRRGVSSGSGGALEAWDRGLLLGAEGAETDSCRWPLFDCNLPGEKGVFLFCGECAARCGLRLRAAQGLPYCREHMAMTYRKPQLLRRTPMAAQCGRRKLIELAAAV
jgi:hypothetical protein